MAEPDWIKAELAKNFARANRAGRNAARSEPRADAARFLAVRNELQVHMTNGASLTLPVSIISELGGAKRAQLARIEVLPGGDALHWESLDVTISLPGLVASLFSPSVWMSELGRRGGTRSTAAKVAAARRNGLRGGRPRAT